MGMDISYRINFATAEAARVAMEAITFPEDRGTSANIYGEPVSTYELTRAGFGLFASTVPGQENIVSASSGSRWMNPKALYREVSADDASIWRAPVVLGHLEFLTNQEALAEATIFYGADSSMPLEDFVKVDEDFMKRLRDFVDKHAEDDEDEDDYED